MNREARKHFDIGNISLYQRCIIEWVCVCIPVIINIWNLSSFYIQRWWNFGILIEILFSNAWKWSVPLFLCLCYFCVTVMIIIGIPFSFYRQRPFATERWGPFDIVINSLFVLLYLVHSVFSYSSLFVFQANGGERTHISFFPVCVASFWSRFNHFYQSLFIIIENVLYLAERWKNGGINWCSLHRISL